MNLYVSKKADFQDILNIMLKPYNINFLFSSVSAEVREILITAFLLNRVLC